MNGRGAGALWVLTVLSFGGINTGCSPAPMPGGGAGGGSAGGTTVVTAGGTAGSGGGRSFGGGTPVDAPAGLTYAMATATYTIGTAIMPNEPTSTGGPISSYGVQPSLPLGLELDSATGVLRGTPTARTVERSYVITGRNASGSTTVEVRLKVDEVAPGSLMYQPAMVTCSVGVACSLPAPAAGGGRVSTYSITPALPTGLRIEAGSGAIFGLPTARAASAQYTVTATNTGGSTTAMVTISVLAPPTGATYRDTPVTYFVGQPIVPNVVNTTGGAPASFAVSPSLPAGLTFDTTTGTISGTPTAVSSTASYTVTVTNPDGSLTVPVSLTVVAVPPSRLTYSPSFLACLRNVACSLAAPTASGGIITAFSVTPALPAGLTLDSSTGAISGTSSVVSTPSQYTVRATNSGGATLVSVTVSVEVPAPPTAISYSPSSVDCRRNLPCTIARPSFAGGAPTSFSITPNLPPGFTFSTADGSISGTGVTLLSSTTFTVTGTNLQGNASGMVTLRVVAEPPSQLTYTPATLTCTRGSSCGVGQPSASGDPATSFSISPSLPTGMAFDSGTGAISGTPTVARTTQAYTITASNAGGSTTALFTLGVTDQPPSMLVYSPSTIVCPRGNTCSVAAPTSSGGAVSSYSISPSLPAGLSLNTSNGSIGGQSNQLASATAYTVTATNSGGTATATLTLSVIELPPSGLSYSGLTCQVGVACTSSPTSTGGLPTSFSITPAPPSWVTFNQSTGWLTGTPPATSTPTSFTVTATNAGGSTTARVTIVAYNPPLPLNVNATLPAIELKNIGIHPTNPAVLFVVASSSRVYRSNDSGQTWQFQCVAPGGISTDYGTVLVSPTGSAFVNAHTEVARVTATGGNCTTLSRSVWASYGNDTWFAFSSNGRIWSWNTNDLSISDDDGVSWQPVLSQASLFRSLAVDPFDDSRLVSVHSQWSTSPSGIVANGPASTSVTTLNANFSSYNDPPIFNPARQGFIAMRMTGTWTANGGQTWSTTGDHAVMAIDSSGAGYRLSGNTLQRTADISAASVTWSSVRSFTPVTSQGERRVRVTGSTILVQVERDVYVSTDSGTTFRQVALAEQVGTRAMQSVVASGSTVVMGMGTGVVVSTDDGANWLFRSVSPSATGSFGTAMRLHAPSSNAQQIYLRGDTIYNNASDMVSTTNAFATSVRTSNTSGGWYARSPFSLDQSNPNIAYAFYNSTAAKTENGGQTWTFTAVTSPPNNWNSWQPSMVGEVSPWSNNRVFYVENNSPRLFVYDHSVGTNVEITSSLPFTNPAGVEVVRVAGSPQLRVISRDGKLAVSTNGTTFTAVNSTGGLSASTSYGRLMKSAVHDPNIIVTAHAFSGDMAISFDGGNSWSMMSMCPGDSIRDIAVSATSVFSACVSNGGRVLRLP